MKTIQITIDERPLKVMNRARNFARSAFIRDALEAEIQRQQIREDEIRLTGDCTRKLVTPGAFEVWLTGVAESFGLGLDND